MPAWGRPRDVRFDEAAADAAIESLAACRFVLGAAWSSERWAADLALASWEGRSADSFATSLRARETTTEEVRGGLLSLQRAIEDAVEDARIEEGRIDRLQSQWDAERRAEVAALRELEDATALNAPDPMEAPM